MPASSHPNSGHRYHLYGVDCHPANFATMSLDRYAQVSTISGTSVCNCDHYHFPNNNDGDLRQLDRGDILRVSAVSVTAANGAHTNGSARDGSTNEALSYLPYEKQRRTIPECCSRCGSDTALMESERLRTNSKRTSKTPKQHYRNFRRPLRDDRKETMRTRRLLFIVIAFIAYVSVGAAIFNAIEARPEQERKQELKVYLEEFLDTNLCVNRSALVDLLQKAVIDSELVYHVTTNMTHLDRWDFTGSFGFVVSVVTTIGFGNLSPFTMTGKAVCLVYALFGIPLTLVMLRGIGEKMTYLICKIRKCRSPVCLQSKELSRCVNLGYITLVGFLVIFIGPALVFTYVEQWHFGESLYFCFTTLSTIGFGDYIIGIHETRFKSARTHELYEMMAYVWIVVGLAYLALAKCYVADLLLAKANTMERGTLRRLATYFRGVGANDRSENSEDSSVSGPTNPGVNGHVRSQALPSMSFPTDQTDASGGGEPLHEVT